MLIVMRLRRQFSEMSIIPMLLPISRYVSDLGKWITGRRCRVLYGQRRNFYAFWKYFAGRVTSFNN